MFLHNFKYTLKILLNNKALLFWTYIFPIILGTLFHFAFSNFENNEKLDTIKIALVKDSTQYQVEYYKQAFESIKDDKENNMFDVKYVDENEAIQLLENNEIIGYLKFDENNPKIIQSENGIEQTVFKYTTDEITELNEIITNKIEKELNSLDFSTDETAQSSIKTIESKVNEFLLSFNSQEQKNLFNEETNKLSIIMIEYYSLIAMACIYGGFFGLTAINYSMPNMSKKGQRISISPAKKNTIVISSMLASFVVQIIGIAILLIYTIFVLKADYGNKTLQMIMLVLFGSIAGLSTGIAIASLLKIKETSKTGVLISLTMFLSYFSGMYGMTAKYNTDKTMPWVNKVNPCSMITDGFYSLYTSSTMDRYFTNIFCLIVYSIILLTISSFSLRRQKYDSI